MVLNFELKGNEYKLLSYIAMNDGLQFSSEWCEFHRELMNKAHMKPATITRTIRSLIDKGYIEKDLYCTWRHKNIRLTDKVLLQQSK